LSILSILTVVAPIFALILAGWLASRLGVLGTQATTELNRFVVYLALPALLFDIVAHVRWAEIWLPGFIAVFGISCLLMFALTLWLRWRRGRPLADAAIDALNASYSNTGFMGFPLVLVCFGREGLAPTLIASIIVVCGVFAIAIVLIEISLQTQASRGRLALKVGGSLARNPLLVAPLLAALFPINGSQPPAGVDSFLKLLGGAASPCALIALGLFLAGDRKPAEAPRQDGAALLVGFKLLLQPLVAWLLASYVFGLDATLTHLAVLLAALPTGTGPFMLAELYRREAEVTSRVILISTVVSLATVSAYLALAT
jgi:malonate transporter